MVIEQTRFDRDAGYRLLGELAGPSTIDGTLAGLDGLAPGFADWIVTALFGGTYQRDGLALRDRQVATLAALTAMGGVEPQLDDHVRNSLRIGVEPREIVEVMVHLAPYVGVPKALAGLRVASAAFQELGLDPVAGGTRHDTAAPPHAGAGHGAAAPDGSGPRQADGATATTPATAATASSIAAGTITGGDSA